MTDVYSAYTKKVAKEKKKKALIFLDTPTTTDVNLHFQYGRHAGTALPIWPPYWPSTSNMAAMLAHHFHYGRHAGQALPI